MALRCFTKHTGRYRLQLTNSEQASAHGGQVLVEALCRRLGLWDTIDQCPHLDPRKRTNQGFSPKAAVAVNGRNRSARGPSNRLAANSSVG